MHDDKQWLIIREKHVCEVSLNICCHFLETPIAENDTFLLINEKKSIISARKKKLIAKKVCV